MLLILLTLVACSTVLWAYLRWTKVRTYWEKRGVPFRPPHPILGSLTFLQRENPAIWMRKLYNDFKCPYVGIWLFWRPALVINSPEIIKRVLVKDSEVFRNRFLSSGKTDPIGSLNMFTANDPIWTTIRRRLTALFTSAKLRNHSAMTSAKAKDLVERIRRDNAKNIPFKVRDLCTDYTTDVIGESAFGITSECVKNGDSVMRGVTRDFQEFNLHRGLSWSSIFFIPELVDIFRFSFFPKHTIERLRKIYRSIVTQRGGYDKEIKESRDLLDILLKMKQEAASENEEMSEDFLLAQAAVLLLGGFDTTAATMSFAIYHLAWHPTYQQKLYEEVLALKKKVGSKDFDLNDLSELTYLNCIIKETLRLFPPMGWLDRIASQDYKIDDKLTIKAGTPVYLNAVATQIDPQYFPEPMVFNPDRFLSENERDITPYTYLPFGEGPRNCIGMRFAYQTLQQGLSSIVLNYEIQTLPDTPKPNDVQVERQGLFLMPLDDKMIVKCVPRE
ncbi:cytochrome P450 6k1-like [Anticarsia gemmatalis]|uniref:cytochrome P450 6k1-like n=1 Tax=Anticarsia gemmatalis TaxID=129554 RepID=UPI003F760BD6